MINRTTKLRWRRRIKKSRNQVEDLGYQAEENLEQHFFKRLNRLAYVRRFVMAWILLLIFLIGGVILQTTALSSYYTETRPVPGGVLTEGILGTFTNANPLFATGPVDNAVSQLVFAGLFKYNSDNKLVGDLAEKWSVDTTEKNYTVTLRPNLQWQDGTPLTAQDVVFSYQTIQNPDAKSPLFASWQGIRITKQNDRTVVFSLPNILASFPHSLTNGIVPEHLLGDIPPAQMRAIRFNTAAPVGAGPFKWSVIELSGTAIDDRQTRIGLVPNERYHGGAPKLQRFVIRAFTGEDDLLKSFENRELTAMSGIDTLPDTFKDDISVKQFNTPLTAQVMVFFKTNQQILSDIKVRQALVQAANQKELISGLGFPVIASRAPFLQSHPGYNADITQLSYNKEQAAKLLTDAGWLPGKDGIRQKEGKELSFSMYSQSTSEYAYVTQKLQRDWQQIGVKVEVLLQPENELQDTVASHSYDALLYGISLGPDPDVYAYWGSTQADQRAANRVNFSEYKSPTADSALEGGRTRSDASLRALKYKPFLEAWRNDAPALALYQPRYLYVTRETIYGFNPTAMNVPTDRYANVENWMIRQDRVKKILH